MKRVYYHNGISYEYKGCEIKRKEDIYFGKKEIYYIFDGKVFIRLRDAQNYIDNFFTAPHYEFLEKREKKW